MAAQDASRCKACSDGEPGPAAWTVMVGPGVGGRLQALEGRCEAPDHLVPEARGAPAVAADV